MFLFIFVNRSVLCGSCRDGEFDSVLEYIISQIDLTENLKLRKLTRQYQVRRNDKIYIPHHHLVGFS